MVRDEPPEMAFDGPYKGSAFENGGGVGGAGGGAPHDLCKLNSFKSFACLLTLNTLLGIRTETVNATEGFAVMEL